jgi:hypothetical protein
MRGLEQDGSARVVIAGHGFVQNLRRGHYELAVEQPVSQRVAVAFRRAGLGDLILGWEHGVSVPRADQMQQSPYPPLAAPRPAWYSTTASTATARRPSTSARNLPERPPKPNPLAWSCPMRKPHPDTRLMCPNRDSHHLVTTDNPATLTGYGPGQARLRARVWLGRGSSVEGRRGREAAETQTWPVSCGFALSLAVR